MISVGEHRLVVCSVEDQEVETMLAGQSVHMLYVDPPWGPGANKMFNTLVKKHTGQEVPMLPWQDVIRRIRQLADDYVHDGFLVCEMGAEWLASTCGLLDDWAQDVYWTRYKTGNTMNEHAVIVGSRGDVDRFHWPGALHGAALPREVLRLNGKRGEIAFDPCCGMGYTAKAAIRAGMRFYGCEINAKKAQETLNVLWGGGRRRT